MTTPVLITLIICITITLLFASIMIAAAVLSKNKQDNNRGNSTRPHIYYSAKDDR